MASPAPPVVSSARPAAGLAALGVLLVIVAGTFDAEPLYVPGVAFVALAAGAFGWVQLAARGVVVTRVLGGRRVVEDEPLDAILSVRTGKLGLPGGVVLDPMLEARDRDTTAPAAASRASAGDATAGATGAAGSSASTSGSAARGAGGDSASAARGAGDDARVGSDTVRQSGEEPSALDAGLPLPFGRAGRRVRIKARFARRGRRELTPPSVVIRDPLGLATKVVAGADRDEVLVLPKLEPVRSLRGPHGDGRARRRGRPAMAAEVELDGVREHRPGTPASRIYWPSLARGAGMMERRLRSEADMTPLIVLDTKGATDAEHRDELDAAVRAVASLAVGLARDGGVAVLLPGDRRPTPLDESLAGWTHLHARLALVQGGGRPGLANLASRVGAVLYVAARPSGRTPRGLEHAPAAGRVLVVPGTLPNRRPSFTVAGCHGYELEGSRMARGRGAAA